MQETRVWPLGQEDPLQKGMATHSNILAWRIPWTENSGSPQSMGSQRVRHNWETNTSCHLTYYGNHHGVSSKSQNSYHLAISYHIQRLFHFWKFTCRKQNTNWKIHMHSNVPYIFYNSQYIEESPVHKEQCCTGTWNVRSMNQGKLEVVKQEMARVNIDILGLSELKWTAMGEFNSDDQYIYYCGQQSHRRNGVAIIVNKRVPNAVTGCNLKNDRMISVHFQGKWFSITVIQAYAPTSNAEAETERFYEDLQDLLN